MKIFKDIKDIDKYINNFKKGYHFSTLSVSLMGIVGGSFLIVSLIIMLFMASYINITVFLILCLSLGLGFTTTTTFVFSFINYIKERKAVIYLEKHIHEIREVLGLELDLDSFANSIENDDYKILKYKEDNVLVNNEVLIKRFFMLDKHDQIQVLEYVKNIIKKNKDIKETNITYFYEDCDKKSLNLLDIKKVLRKNKKI